MLPSIGPFFARTAFVEVCGESRSSPTVFHPLASVLSSRRWLLALIGRNLRGSPRSASRREPDVGKSSPLLLLLTHSGPPDGVPKSQRSGRLISRQCLTERH